MRQVSKYFSIVFLLTALLSIAQSQQSNGVDITIDRSGVLLKGKFYVAAGESIFPTVILLHGFPGNETDVLGIGDKLSQSGINALTFNYAGSYQSQGTTSLENNQKDIGAAFDFIRQPDNIRKFKIDTTCIYLGGWCHGGGMALAYAASHPEVTTVFSIAGNDLAEFMRSYVLNSELKKMVDQMFEEMITSPAAVKFDKGALPKEMAETGIEKMNPIFDLKKNAPHLAKKDILLIGGWNDVQTTIDQFLLPLYRALQKEKAQRVQIATFQDGHYFKNTKDDVARMVVEWIKKAPERKKM
jgi:esterase/lipase